MRARSWCLDGVGKCDGCVNFTKGVTHPGCVGASVRGVRVRVLHPSVMHGAAASPRRRLWQCPCA